ncbi:TlpA family protein disulfide reductase [Carboxylicivirga taeanensis]|uniref:TlpA family protein disulfide reductase n=1 Tax=Carboxylicivirga taeanensis TaxID=1416875 RepID=UPI003F6E2028
MKYTLILLVTLLMLACSKPQKTPYLTIKPDRPIREAVELYSLEGAGQLTLFDKAIQESDESSLVFRKDSVPIGIYELRMGGKTIRTLIISTTFPSTISGHLDTHNSELTITGNAETKAYWKCKGLAQQAEREIEQLVEAIPDSLLEEDFYVARDSIYTAIDHIIAEKAKEINRLCDNYRNSLVPLLTMQLKAGNHYIFKPEEYSDLYYEVGNQLQSLYPAYLPVKQFAAQVDSIMSRILFSAITKEGRTMPALTVPNAWNKQVELENLGNAPTLFVLWKSTDKASRSITKQLMRWTRPYRNKGLQVCMISLDSDRTSWLNAVKEDRLAVLHLSDLVGDESPVLHQLGLRSVPYLLLVDENRMVVKRSRDLEELTPAMRQLIKN